MSKAHALPTGLGIEDEGLELPLDELPEWEDSKVKVFPMVCAAWFLDADAAEAGIDVSPLPSPLVSLTRRSAGRTPSLALSTSRSTPAAHRRSTLTPYPLAPIARGRSSQTARTSPTSKRPGLCCTRSNVQASLRR
jgi:hypothetical protein